MIIRLKNLRPEALAQDLVGGEAVHRIKVEVLWEAASKVFYRVHGNRLGKRYQLCAQ